MYAGGSPFDMPSCCPFLPRHLLLTHHAVAPAPHLPLPLPPTPPRSPAALHQVEALRSQLALALQPSLGLESPESLGEGGQDLVKQQVRAAGRRLCVGRGEGGGRSGDLLSLGRGLEGGGRGRAGPGEAAGVQGEVCVGGGGGG